MLVSAVLAAFFASVENESAPKSPTFYTAIVMWHFKKPPLWIEKSIFY
jgi:hypothetical protein